MRPIPSEPLVTGLSGRLLRRGRVEPCSGHVARRLAPLRLGPAAPERLLDYAGGVGPLGGRSAPMAPSGWDSPGPCDHGSGCDRELLLGVQLGSRGLVLEPSL